MRADRIRLVNGGLLYRKNETVGPQHDPYARTTVELLRDKKTVWRLVACGLAGEWLETADGKRVTLHEGIFLTRDERDRWRELFEQKVRQVTGQSSRFWLDKVWEVRDRAMWRRMTPQQRWEYEMCMEADAQLMSYAE